MAKKRAVTAGIDLNTAIAAMKSDLDDFRAYWEEARRKDPSDYEDQPTMADWEDQFQVWRELKDGTYNDD